MKAGAFPVFLVGALEVALNQALRLDEEARAALAPLSGKVIALEFVAPAVTLYIVPDAHGLTLLGRYEGEVNAHIRAAPFSLLRMLWENDQRLVSGGEIHIEGEVGTAQRLLEIFRGLDMDWEEPLARALGDAPAHWLGRMARHGRRWQRESAALRERDLGEYLQEELRLVPARAEVSGLVRQIDTLRADSDRMEQRVRRLERLTGENRRA